MEDNAMYDIGLAADELDARSAAAIEALQHESANLREVAEMRAKTALDLKATSDAQVKVASTVNLINRSMSGAFRALAALRAKILAYKDETAQAAEELLAEAEEIEKSLRENQEETFEAVTQVLGSALGEISGDSRAKDAERHARGEEHEGPAPEAAPRPAEEEPAMGSREAEEAAETAHDEPIPVAADDQEQADEASEPEQDAAQRAADIDRRVAEIDDLDEPDGVGEGHVQPSPAARAAAERDEYKRLLEEERAAHAAEMEALAASLEARAAAMIEKALAGKAVLTAAEEAPDAEPEPEHEEPAGEREDDGEAVEAGDEHSGQEPPAEAEENAESLLLGVEPAQVPASPASPAPRGFGQTRGFGGSAATRVADAYAAARGQRAGEPYAVEANEGPAASEPGDGPYERDEVAGERPDRQHFHC